MIITTTNSIENATVEKYLGVVTTNLVIGTGFFSDFMASFTDFFGGMSGTYRKQMDELYQKAYDALSLKASSMGANGVLGFKIDFDEISGKGVQMFMISVSGTAVKLSMEDHVSDVADKYGLWASAEKVNVELFKLNWGRRDKHLTPKANELTFIMDHNLWELVPSLYEYFSEPNQTFDTRQIDERFPIILSVLPYEEAVQFIYNDYPNRYERALPLIKENKLFCAKKVLELLQEGHMKLAIDLLEVEKSAYFDEDLKDMESILEYLNNLPDKGQITEVKAGAFSSKMVEMYICPAGHKNDKDVEFCEHDYYCGLNIKGLTHRQLDAIHAFGDKVTVIKCMLHKAKDA